MANNYCIVANWKMEFTHRQSLEWLRKYYKELVTLVEQAPVTLILCPLVTCLEEFGRYIQNNSIKLGAQNCSFVAHGAHTGEINVKTLKELGCSYCIVGHSERREYHFETNAHVAQKVQLLLEQGISPIICIGETQQERLHATYRQALEQQLAFIFEHDFILQHTTPLYIAYEPVWAIGTGNIPTYRELNSTFSWLKEHLMQKMQKNSTVHCKILYGGSVNSSTLERFLPLSLDGFLVGKASLDFQELKKIALLVEKYLALIKPKKY